MKAYHHKIKVKGQFLFPTDMLRYDGAYPATQADSVKINASESRLRSHEDAIPLIVTLFAVHGKDWKPTAARWASFGWMVVEHTTVPLNLSY